MALLELLASEASAPLLPHNSRRQGSDIYHAPVSYISSTKLLRMPLVEPLYLSLEFGTTGKDSATSHESAELPK